MVSSYFAYFFSFFLIFPPNTQYLRTGVLPVFHHCFLLSLRFKSSSYTLRLSPLSGVCSAVFSPSLRRRPAHRCCRALSPGVSSGLRQPWVLSVFSCSGSALTFRPRIHGRGFRGGSRSAPAFGFRTWMSRAPLRAPVLLAEWLWHLLVPPVHGPVRYGPSRVPTESRRGGQPAPVLGTASLRPPWSSVSNRCPPTPIHLPTPTPACLGPRTRSQVPLPPSLPPL